MWVYRLVDRSAGARVGFDACMHAVNVLVLFILILHVTHGAMDEVRDIGQKGRKKDRKTSRIEKERRRTMREE